MTTVLDVDGSRPLPAADGHVRILHLEDNPADALLTQERLREVRPAAEFTHIMRLADLAALEGAEFDCVLLDLSLPDAAGLDVIGEVKRGCPGVPVLVLTGHDDVATGVDAVRKGAQDYIVKNRADGMSLDRSIRYALERIRLERMLADQALHDSLTGLPNRVLFGDRLDMAVERTRRTGRLFALLMLDLDHFKGVNDTLGHAAGDALLVQVATRLKTALRPSDTLCRLGGDEFTVLCEEFPAQAEVAALAERLAARLEAPFEMPPHSLHVGVSIGVALSSPGCTPEGVMRDADTALYAAKNAGRGRVAWFSDELHAAAETRFSLENSLREALRTGRGFSVAYQSIVDLASDRVVGIEALARWCHPQRGSVAPVQFIPLAESAGLITALDLRVIDLALDELVSRRAQNPNLTLSVNISGQTLASRDFASEIGRRVAERHLPPGALTLEILETALLAPTAAAVVARLREEGFRIALDDFGAGVSSLNHFVYLVADVLKLDRSFVIAAAGGNQRAVALLRLIVQAGRELGMSVVAEGVEGQPELEVCRDLGVRRAQGFLWGRV